MRLGQHPIEAPTHLRSHQIALPPECLTEDDDDLEPPTGKAEGSGNHRLLEAVSARVRTERSVHAPQMTPKPERERSPSRPGRERPASKPERERREVHETGVPALPPPPHATPRRRTAPAAAPVAEPAPSLPAAAGTFDPMQIAVPPELAGPIYSWIRRLALQADLAGADRVIRDAILDTSSSLSCSVIYPGQDGLWTLGGDDEMPADSTPLVAVAQARRAVIASHMALIPVLTSTETVAVIVVHRNPRNPGYHPVEQIAMIALARESAAILHHLAVAHLQKQREVQLDAKSLYRGEALEAHRSRGTEGDVVNLSPMWVRRAYPLLCGTLVVALVFSIFVHVNTYSTGRGMIVYAGEMMTSPGQGTVKRIRIEPGTQVKVGTILVELDTQSEQIELADARKDYDNAQVAFLWDMNDEQIKKTLAASAARVEKAASVIATKTIRSRVAGVVGELKIKVGQLVQPGSPIALVNPPDSAPEVIVFLPSTDRPRLKPNMTLQVAVDGFKKTREMVTITSMSTEGIGGADIGRVLGDSLAESMKIGQEGGQFIVVRARMPETFRVNNRTYRYHHGMSVKAEVIMARKPFLADLLPALEKYLPD